MTIKIQEQDLFQPIKDFYEKLGYVVEGEVKNCDVLIKMGQDFMAVELKADLNFKVVLQAVQRQKLFDLVYIAVPIQKIKQTTRTYKEKLHLLKRLGIGLLLVNSLTGEVACVQQPVPAERNRIMTANKKKKDKVITEFEQRIIKNNIGGINHQKITTYYRQQCYQVAYLLRNKPQSAAELAKYGLDRQRINTILRGNFYGWFEKVKRGIYQLSPLGQEMVETEKEKIEILMKELSVGSANRQKTAKE